jgi:HEPN domain-containing protein
MTATPETIEVVRRWIARADGHLAAARVLLRCAEENAFDAVCYHCHEAVATIVKAVLTLEGIVAPRIHDLEYLHRMIPQPSRFVADPGDLAWMSTYGIERWWDPDRAQAARAVAIAAEVRSSAVESLGPAIVPGVSAPVDA